MKLIKTLLCCFFLLGISQTSNAQFWKKLKKKAQEKISKTEDKIIDKLDKKTDKKIDDTIDGKKKNEKKIVQSNELPKLIGGSGYLKLYSHGYEYISKDITVSVYGSFTKTNLSKSVKTYNQDRIIKPIDAFPEGYALAYNGGGFLNPQNAQIIIHHADSTNVVFSVKGTWNTVNDPKKPISGSFVKLNVAEIIDKRIKKKDDFVYKKKQNTTNSDSNNAIYNSNKNATNVSIPDSFSFTSSLEIKMTSSDGSSADLEFLLGNYSNIYAMSIAAKEMGNGGKVYNVVTPKSITMFMDVAGMKMKKTVSQDQMSQANFGDKVPNNPEELKKTGATKTILGYTCYEYKHTNDGGYVSVWATKDFPMQATKINMLGMRQNGPIEGFVLEIDMKSRNESGNMKAIKFNRNKNVTINTKEYKSMGF